MHVEDHLPENYLRNLLEMLPIPGLYARSTEPDSRGMKFGNCFTTHSHKCFLSMNNFQNHSFKSKFLACVII